MKRRVLIPGTLLIGLLICSNALSEKAKIKDGITYKTESDILYREQTSKKMNDYMKKRCRLDIYYPASQKEFTTVIWFHGGGIQGGEKFIPEQLKNQGISIVAVNYRLYPKVSCPTYIEDAAAAVAWVFKNIHKYGGDPSRIYVSGHSAGGYLTSMVGLDTKYLAVHGVEANKIACLIPYSGHTITHFTVRKERGIPGTQPIIDEYAPLFHVRTDAPPLVLITGDRDLEMLGRYEENAYMMRMMKVVGHEKTELYEIQGFNHGEMAEPAHGILLRCIQKHK
jgi:acetyl esterase/lipase